ncbi:hypothetical protein V1477_019490 [Vespula maculifrons]|uniref:Uncharacterized protein n=1 Tax=Vespula maculifrons TaxID=7453 RepID=A0ABD2AQK2_VESMC
MPSTCDDLANVLAKAHLLFKKIKHANYADTNTNENLHNPTNYYNEPWLNYRDKTTRVIQSESQPKIYMYYNKISHTQEEYFRLKRDQRAQNGEHA